MDLPQAQIRKSLYQGPIPALYRDVYRKTVNWNEAAARALFAAKAESRSTYEEIVNATGISESTVKRYLAGTRAVPVEHFAAIARALGRDPLALFAEVEARVQNDE